MAQTLEEIAEKTIARIHKVGFDPNQWSLVGYTKCLMPYILAAIKAGVAGKTSGKTEADVSAGHAPKQKWLPIESAPKDGTVIDLLLPSGSRYTDCYWGKPNHECGEAGEYCDSCPDHDGWCATDGFVGYLTGPDGIYKQGPTHWMPLPELPEASEADSVGRASSHLPPPLTPTPSPSSTTQTAGRGEG